MGTFVVFKKEGEKSVFLPFVLVCLTTVWWQGAWAVLFNIRTEESAYLWIKIGYSGIIFIPFCFYHFISSLTKVEKGQKFIAFLYSIGTVFLILLWSSNYFIDGYYKYFWGYYPKAGILHPLYLIFLAIATLRIFVMLLQSLRTEEMSAVRRNQIKYVLALIGIYAIAAFDFAINYGIEIYPFGFIFVIASLVAATYAIARYRLMDIHIVFKRTMAYSLSAGLLTGFFIIFVLSVINIFSTYTDVDSFKVSILAALVIAFLFNPLRNKIQSYIDKIFYKRTYDYYAVIRKISLTLATNFNLNEIYSFICDTVLSSLGLRSIYILSDISGGHYETVYHSEYRKERGEKKKSPEMDEVVPPLKAINDQSDMIKMLNHSRDVVVKDELEGIGKKLGRETVNSIKGDIGPFHGEVVVPVFVDDKLTLLIMLGEKLSGDMFTDEDINLLNTISHQTAIAVKNARLYKENISAEKFASIGMMSATFAHEIRNPLTSLKTFAQLMPEKYNDEYFRDNFSKIVLGDIERIDGLINDLLDFSTKKMFAGIDSFDLTSLIDETVDYLKNKLGLENKKINIEKQYTDTIINMIGNANMLKQAFTNIINNGYQAMETDGVLNVNISPNGEAVKVSITDTGDGISAGEIAKIFDPFYTTKPMGVGLGLAISKRIIEDHGGKIEVKSQLSSGTTFTVSLPVNDN
jgi:signal transduction histidine kinase